MFSPRFSLLLALIAPVLFSTGSFAAGTGEAAIHPYAPYELLLAATAPRPRDCRRAPTIAIAPSQISGLAPGTLATFNVTLRNNDGNACGASTFDLTRSVGTGWTATFQSGTISLSPGASGSTTLGVTSPLGTPGGSYTVTATGTHRNATGLSGTASATYVVAAVCARANPAIVIAPAQSAGVPAGTLVPFTVTVTNRDSSACGASPFELAGSVPTGWTGTLSTGAVSLAPGASGSATLQVTSPLGAADSANTIAATAKNAITSALFSATGTASYVVVANPVAATSVTGTVYYVSTSGRDTNDGRSTQSPFATLAKAESTATSPGDVIALRRGDTWSSANALRISHGGSIGRPTVWDGGLWGTGANAVIQSSANRTPRNMAVVNIIGTRHVTFQNITIDGNNTQTFGIVIGGMDGYYSYPSAQNAESYITVRDTTIKNCGNGGDYRQGVLVSTFRNDMSNIALLRLVIDGTDDQAIAFYPGKSQDGAVPARISNSYVGHSTITNYGRRKDGTAIALMINNRTTDTVIENNTITTGPNGFGAGLSLASNEVNAAYYPTGITVRYNDIRVASKYAAFIQDGRPKTADFYYNRFSSATTVTGGSEGGFAVFASSPSYTGASLRFFNNVFYTNGGVAFFDGTSTAGVVTFRNNIVYNTGANSEHYGIRTTTAGSMVHSHNAVYMPADAARITVNSGASYYTRSTLTGWEATARASDPLMTSPGAFDFTLRAGSPAIDAGTSVGLSRDYAGTSVPQGAAPDIGAYEWR